VDYAVCGEGEMPFLDLVNHIFSPNSKRVFQIPGIYRKAGRKIVGEANNENYINLKNLPFPNYNLLPLDAYYRVKKRIYVHTSRGCGFNCRYCSVPAFWKKVRRIPIELLLNQLEKMLDIYNPEQLHIVDDDFSHKKGIMIKQFCEGLGKRKISIPWKCQARADILTEDLVILMAESECFEIDMGIESGNPEIQNYIRKNLNLNKTKAIISQIADKGIEAKAFFMIGFPNESYEQITDTINFSVSLKDEGLKSVAFFPVMPFPGTSISKETGKEVFQGAIIDDPVSIGTGYEDNMLRKYSSKPEVSLNKLFSPDDLRLLVKFAYHQFNLARRVDDLKKEFQNYLEIEESEMLRI
ncbi:MAG TPA: radical SAM protein, partial [bacterium]|nr:radical SAM protein [bacterium]